MNDDLEARLRGLAEHEEDPVAFSDVKSRSGRQLATRLGAASTMLAVVVVAAFVIPAWLAGDDGTTPVTPATASARMTPNTTPATLAECPTTDGMLAAPPTGWVKGPKDALVTDTAPGRIVVCSYSGVGQPDLVQNLKVATAVTNAGDMAFDLSRVQAVFADVMPCTEEFRDTDRDQFLVAVTYPNGTAVWLNASGNHCGHSITNGTFVTDDSQWAQLTQTAATGIWPTSGAPTTPVSPPSGGTLDCPAVGDIATSPEGLPMTVPVPGATAPGADKALVRTEAPISATVCGYSIWAMRGGTATPDQPAPSFLGRVPLANLEELAADLHAAKPWSGERACTMAAGDIYRYAVALQYPEGVIWVGVEDEPNHCLPASNGRFTADDNFGQEVANAFRTGAWKGKAPAITCPDITVGDLPPVVSHVEVPAAPTVPGADGFLTSPDVPSSGYVCTYRIVGDDGVMPPKDQVLAGSGIWLERPDALSATLSQAKQRGSEPLVCDTITGPQRRHLVHFTYPAGEIWVAVEESESGCARAWNGAFEADVNLGAVVSAANDDGLRKAVDWPGTAAEGFAIPCVNSYDAQGKLIAPTSTSAAARKAMTEAKLLVTAHPQEMPMATFCTDGQAVQLLYVMDGTAGQAEAEQIKVDAGAWEAANPGAAKIRTVDPSPSFAKLVVDRIKQAPAELGVAGVRYDAFTGLTVITMKTEAPGGNLVERVVMVKTLAEPGPTELWPMEIPLRFRTGETFTVR